MIYVLIMASALVFANIVQDDVAITEKTRHSYKYACAKSGYPDSPLIEEVSGTQLDCMSRKIDVGAFCEKEMAHDPYYLRSYVDKAAKEVVCVSGKKVIFKYKCGKLSDRALCDQEAKSACAFVQKKLARRLDVVHSSFTESRKKIKELNCYFESLPLRDRHGI